MTGTTLRRKGRFALAAGIVALGSMLVLRPAQAVDAGTAVGIGLGSFALGTALGSAANPYNNPYYSGYYYPAPAYGYAPPGAPYYYSPRSCWDAYYRRYYAC